MKKVLLGCVLLLTLSVGCYEPTRDVIDNKKDLSLKTMDLGMALWKRQIILFDGDIKKADSAYRVDKKVLNDDIYKSIYKEVEKEDSKLNQKANEKECKHIFYNRYCYDCREYRLHYF